MTTMLLDTDMILYPAIARATTEVEFDDGEWIGPYVNLPVAKAVIQQTIADLQARAGCIGTVCCLSDHSGNWRKGIYPSYKQSRSGKKPYGWMQLEEWIKTRWTTQTFRHCEADDVMGILATTPGGLGDRGAVVVSDDKDLRTIPGRFMTIRGDEDPEDISIRDADMWHLKQALMGDRVDDYPGCPGYGIKTAEKLLDPLSADIPTWSEEAVMICWRAVAIAYEKKGILEEDALVQARVARILRASDWNSDTQEVILWKP
jgi:DNA polymerase-1